MRDFTPDGRIGRLVVRGARLTTDVAANVRSGSIELSTDEVTTLDMQIADPDLGLLDSRLFDTGAAVDFVGLKLAVASVEVVDDSGVPHLHPVARSLGVRNMRASKGAHVWRNVSPSQVAIAAGKKAGLTVVAQPSAKRRHIARKKNESDWGLLVDRLAKSLGFICFEAQGTLYFGKPSWLLARAKTRRLVKWDRANQTVTGTLASFPQCRRAEDSKRNAAEVTFSIVGGDSEEWRPGDVVQLEGIPSFDGAYLVTSVSIPLDDADTISVTASTPEDPKPEKQAKAKSSGKVSSSGTSSTGGTAATVERFVQNALNQVGDSYVYGAEASKSDPDPDAFDCSELVEWALARVGVYIPDGSSAQRAYCQRKGTIISIESAINTRGALLFADGHVEISLGDGRTVGAVNRSYGVTTMNARGRVTTTWIAGAKVPGLAYPRRG